MHIGDIRTIVIPAREKWVNTGVPLTQGHEYELLASGTWHDASIACGPAGYSSPGLVFRLVERFRRAPRQNWFALVGTYDQDASSAFLIGDRCILSATRSATLHCFANDLGVMYANNTGSVELTVKRVR
jgi:hypothetical protein